MQLIPAKRRPSSYLSEGPLADVLALIQVLALDEHARRILVSASYREVEKDLLPAVLCHYL